MVSVIIFHLPGFVPQSNHIETVGSRSERGSFPDMSPTEPAVLMS
jgi:hypothetical protein